MSSSASVKVLLERAQAMCDADGKPRWVKYTSLGWRIEREPPTNDLPCHAVVPAHDPA
jgi:hypothetical protein